MTTTIHIRKSKQGGRDRRLALRHSRAGSNKNSATLCGAEPTGEDMGRADGAHWLSQWRPMLHHPSSPQWAREKDASLCAACAGKLVEPA